MSIHLTFYLTEEEHQKTMKACEMLGMTFKEFLFYAMEQNRKRKQAEREEREESKKEENK